MSDYSENPLSHAPRPVPPPLPASRTSVKAALALALGILSPVFWLFTAIPALILAGIAKRDIRKQPGLGGRAMANWGLGLGAASVLLAPVFLVLLALPFAHAEGGPREPPENAARIVHFHLHGMLAEAPSPDPMAALSAPPPQLQLLLRRMEKAQEDDAVEAVVVTLDGFLAGFAQVEELHGALRTLKASGKRVYVHTEEASLSTGTYALLAGASEINVTPTSFINLTGIYTEGLFLKEGLSKLGVQADIIHIGDYKSAGEMFTRSEPSEVADEAMNWLLDGLYERCVSLIAEGRGMTAATAREAIDGGPYTAERARESGLIDSVQHRDAFLASLKEGYGDDIYIDNHYGQPRPPNIDLKSPLAPLQILFSDMGKAPRRPAGDAVAIVNVEGPIVPGYSDPSAFGASGAAYSGDIRNALDQAREDDTIKAVVMRVNSPGGSVIASEVILQAAKRVRETKPLVVSMGNVAASGGYYVASNADAIFASENSITASIGVVGGKVVTADMWSKLGVNWHPYQRGENANWMSSGQPFTEAQRQHIRAYMGNAYTTFKNHVVAGRGDKLAKPIEDMAGGRVFTGKQAHELGLVDQLGGLREATAHAAELADIEDYHLRLVPDPVSVDQMILDLLLGPGGDRPSDLELARQQKAPAAPHGFTRAMGGPDAAGALGALRQLDPVRTKTALQLMQYATLLGNEGVLAVTPQLLAVP